MPHLIYYVASSLDGFIADEDGGVDWLPDPGPDTDFGYARFLETVDALLMGRRTYEQVRSFGDWPYPGLQTRVWTRRSLESAPDGVAAVAGAPAGVVEGLEREGFARVWLVGGAELAEALRREGLIDEWIISLVPRTLGSGIPLFGGAQEDLQVTAVESFPGSVTQLHLTRRR